MNFKLKNLQECVNWAINKPPKIIKSATRSIKSQKAELQLKERLWGNIMINKKNTGQWSTLLGEYLVHDILLLRGKNPKKCKIKGNFKPDLETDNYIYEVKTSSWFVSGTAGEKVLGTWIKYQDIPKLYGKPLKIVCIAYQEEELTNGKIAYFGNNVTLKTRQILNIAKSWDIEYIRFSDLVSPIMEKLLNIYSPINKQSKKEYNLQKPFLKWVGGKTQIIRKIINKFPTVINNYHEIFLGGGSVLLALLSAQKHGKLKIKNRIYAYDINEALIYVYKHIQCNVNELFEFIEQYMKEYTKITGDIINRKPINIKDAKTSKESYYYWMRKRYNSITENSIERSALFMILNKTCFRGMYREGPNGYNVPFGHYKKVPTIITKSDLSYISNLIKDVEFKHADFSISLENIQDNDFIYLDPPYVPENKKSFVKYVSNGFNLEKHIELFNRIKKNKNIKIMMSNSKTELVMNNFKNYNIEDIIARRAINAKNPGATTNEVLIYNYKLEEYL